jgi:acetyl esterase/lipase
MRTVAYGPAESQRGDLHLPMRAQAPVVCLLHGGFWRIPYGREQWTAVIADLVARGCAVWNLGYRRLGEPGGGWPGTLEDVDGGIQHLARLVADGADLDLSRVTVVGHSAGGQLALWAAARQRQADAAAAFGRVRIAMAVGLAPVADLERAHVLRLGDGAVEALLGGTPARVPERLRAASPLAALPLGVPQLILHGVDDTAVPIALSRGYARAAEEAGDTIELIELPGLGHMEFLDPASAAQAALSARLAIA